MWKQIGHTIDAAQRQNYFFGQEKYGWMHSANKRQTKIKIMSAFGTNRKLTCIQHSHIYHTMHARTPASQQAHKHICFRTETTFISQFVNARVHQSQSQSQRVLHTQRECVVKNREYFMKPRHFPDTHCVFTKSIWKTIKQTTKITKMTKKIPLSQSMGPKFFRGWNFCLWSLYEHGFFNVAHILCTSQVKLLFGRHTHNGQINMVAKVTTTTTKKKITVQCALRGGVCMCHVLMTKRPREMEK